MRTPFNETQKLHSNIPHLTSGDFYCARFAILSYCAKHVEWSCLFGGMVDEILMNHQILDVFWNILNNIWKRQKPERKQLWKMWVQSSIISFGELYKNAQLEGDNSYLANSFNITRFTFPIAILIARCIFSIQYENEYNYQCNIWYDLIKRSGCLAGPNLSHPVKTFPP